MIFPPAINGTVITRDLVLPQRVVPRPRNLQRRLACERDLLRFAMTYFPKIFWDPNKFHKEFAIELQRLMLSQTVQQLAIAAPRGIGKTTEVLIAMVWGACNFLRRFFAIFALKEKSSFDRLLTIKNAFKNNERLYEDFPELCGPIRAFDGDPKRAPPEYPWSTEEIRLPNDVWFVAVGIEGSFLGLNKNALRPDFCLIDDPENSTTVKSIEMTATIERRIRDEICSLETLGQRTAYLLLTTIRKTNCIGHRFTDPSIEPEWCGKRYRALIKPPVNMDHWDTFKEMCRRHEAVFTGDAVKIATAVNYDPEKFIELRPGNQVALEYYATHKSVMDEGAELLDEIRLPLHSCMHKIATKGESVWASEYQNDPLQDTSKRDQQLDVDYLLRRRIPGQAPGRVPIWSDLIIVTIDVGMYRLHWECDAWNAADETSMLIDQGIEDTGINAAGKFEMSDERAVRTSMITQAVVGALQRIQHRCANGWPKDTGEMLTPYVGVDAGGGSQAEKFAWFRDVLEFCLRAGPDWKPLKGANWTDGHLNRAEGRNYCLNEDMTFYELNVDEYKRQLMRAFYLPPFDESGAAYPGTRLLHGATPTAYCKHQTAERYFESFDSGKRSDKAERSGWVKLSQQNHWFDTASMNRAMFDIVRQIRLRAATERPPEYTVPGNQDQADGQEQSYPGGEDPLMQ